MEINNPNNIVPLITLVGVTLTFIVGVLTLINTRRLELLKEASGYRTEAFRELQAARKRLQAKRTTIGHVYKSKDTEVPDIWSFLKEFREHYMDDYDEYKTIRHLLAREQRTLIDDYLKASDKADAECFSSIAGLGPDSSLPSEFGSLMSNFTTNAQLFSTNLRNAVDEALVKHSDRLMG